MKSAFTSKKKHILLNSRLANSLSFAIKLSKLLKVNLIVSDESDDPYQWILIQEDNLFLVESGSNGHGINIIEASKKELARDKALALMPNMEYFFNKLTNDYMEKPYFVTPSKKWFSALK